MTFIHFRRRALDADNYDAKDLLDSLWRIGIIPNDDPGTVEKMPDQFRKVASAAEEGTEIVIERIW